MKPTVLALVSFYLPGYRAGGPIRTISNMIEGLGDDFDFRIISRDRDMGENVPYKNVNVDAWNIVGKAHVYYASPEKLRGLGIPKLLRETRFDVLYLNSFFDPVFTICPLLALRMNMIPPRPVVVAPRGEFSAGALRLKHFKKWVFINLVRFVGLYREILWHASTELEASDIRRTMGVGGSQVGDATEIFVAPNVVTADSTSEGSPPDLEAFGGLNKPLRICFLSRISRMKNLDFALKILMCVESRVEFHIYGPKEDVSYWNECQAIISAMPDNISVVYKGVVAPSDVLSVIGGYDVFFVPTRGENFGHVYFEALLAGVPILVSDNTPWRGLVDLKIGWDISLDHSNEFVQAINSISTWDLALRREIRVACFRYAKDKVENGADLGKNRQLFRKILEA